MIRWFQYGHGFKVYFPLNLQLSRHYTLPLHDVNLRYLSTNTHTNTTNPHTLIHLAHKSTPHWNRLFPRLQKWILISHIYALPLNLCSFLRQQTTAFPRPSHLHRQPSSYCQCKCATLACVLVCVGVCASVCRLPGNGIYLDAAGDVVRKTASHLRKVQSFLAGDDVNKKSRNRFIHVYLECMHQAPPTSLTENTHTHMSVYVKSDIFCRRLVWASCCTT